MPTQDKEPPGPGNPQGGPVSPIEPAEGDEQVIDEALARSAGGGAKPVKAGDLGATPVAPVGPAEGDLETVEEDLRIQDQKQKKPKGD